MPGTVVTTGCSGGPALRLEINDFIENTKYFSLFIQALSEYTRLTRSAVVSHLPKLP